MRVADSGGEVSAKEEHCVDELFGRKPHPHQVRRKTLDSHLSVSTVSFAFHRLQTGGQNLISAQGTKWASEHTTVSANKLISLDHFADVLG